MDLSKLSKSRKNSTKILCYFQLEQSMFFYNIQNFIHMILLKAFIRIRQVLSASIISSWNKTAFYVVGLVELNFYKLIQILDFSRKENIFATIILILQERFTSNQKLHYINTNSFICDQSMNPF